LVIGSQGKINSKLNRLFKPKSIAIIGASDNFSKISGRTLKYLLRHGFKGRIFPINPSYRKIAGIKCFPKITNVPEEVDLAIISRPRQFVLDILKDCAKKGVSNVLIYSSGFAEIGAEGKGAQELIKRFAKENNIRVLGPNCIGFVNLHDRVIATFGGSMEREDLIPGETGFLSQSGAFVNLTFPVAQQMGIGFSYWISTGNEMDIVFSDCLGYLIDDDRTKLIFCFIEGMKNGTKFLRIADKAVEAKKPIIVMKVGRSPVGAEASLSHTGAMTGLDDIYNAVFQQKRMVRAYSIEELLDYIFVMINCPPPKGKNVGILSITGGGAILMTDKFDEWGLKVPPLEGKTKDKMLEIIPLFGSAINPIDLTGQLINGVQSVGRSIDLLMEEDSIDIVVVFIAMLRNFRDELVEYFEKAARKQQKPIAIVWMVPPEGVVETLRSKGIPTFEDPIRCVNAMGALYKYTEAIEILNNSKVEDLKKVKKFRPRKKEINGILESLRISSGTNVMTEYNAKKILNHYGIPIPKERVVTSIPEAIKVAGEIGYPVALKVLSPQITHRRKKGLVRLNIKEFGELDRAYHEMISKTKALYPNAEIEGMLVQEMVAEGIETIIGMKEDPVFGNIISFGIGGIFTEVIKDISLRVLPISELDATEMVTDLKASGIFKGNNQGTEMDLEILLNILVRFSNLCFDLKDKISEFDINPLILDQKGTNPKVVDALIILK
jgi:acetyltransferase